MKKIICLAFIPLLLTACSAKSYTPIIESSFCYDAKYIMGDFCFNANVMREEEIITIEVLDTRAKGLIMEYDGQTIEFRKDALSCKLDATKLDKTNPSILIKDIYDYISKNCEASVKKSENGFVYTGMTSLGSFEAYQNFDNKFYLILVPDANIRIELTSVEV